MRFLPLLAILLIATVLRLPALFQPPWYMDEGIFAAVADAWRQGDALYTDVWDNKPPGIFAVYVLGWSTGLEMIAVRLLDLAAMLGVIALVYAMGRRAGGELSGLLAAAVAGILLGLPTIEGHIANTESFLILFSTLGMYAVLRGIEATSYRDALILLAGFAFGIACLFKQTAVFDVLAVLLFLGIVYRAGVWRPAAMLCAGVVALPLAVAVLFVALGSFGDLWSATVTSLVGYREDSTDTGLERYLVALIPMVIALPYAVRLQPWRTRTPEALFVLWLAFTALAVSASGRAYPHYLLQMAPPFALTAGMLASVYRPRLPRASVALGVITASLVLSHVILGPWPNLAWNREPTYTRDYYDNFVAYATGDIDRGTHDGFFDRRAHAHLGLYEQIEALEPRPRDVFVWGDVPWLYTEAGFNNPIAYPALFNAGDVEGGVEAVASLLLEARPEYVLVMEETRESWQQVQPQLGDLYAPAQELLRAVLYVRR